MLKEALDKYKLILLDTFKTFDKFCNDHGLSYFAAGGTAIGAVRHHGMIPWDDDMDVYMLRKDYDRFLALREELIPLGYLVSALGDDDCIYPFAKMYSSSTTLVEQSYTSRCCVGPYLDILPLDEVAGGIDDVAKMKEKYHKLHARFMLSYFNPTWHNISEWIHKRHFSTLAKSLAPGFVKKRIRTAFISFDKEWSSETGDTLFCHWALYPIERELFPEEWFSSYHYVPFEDCEIRVNDMVHEYLTQLFGDYMTPPPVEKQIQGHELCYLNLRERLSAKEVQKRLKKGEHLVY